MHSHRMLPAGEPGFFLEFLQETAVSFGSLGLPVATVTAERDRVLTGAELADVWAAVAAMTDPPLQRREEVAAIHWLEFVDIRNRSILCCKSRK